MRAALIVDDDAIHVLNAQSLLEPLGFELIDAVPNGKAAQTYFRNHPPPEVVLRDLNRPDSDGVEFMNFLIDAADQRPIVIVSGAQASIQRGASQRAIANGLNVIGIIEKPLTLAKLASAFAHA